MEFRVLGPLEVVDGERPIALRKGKECALLAFLVLHANEVVPSERLIDELWGERPPATAPKILQNAVSHLRKALGDGRLLTRGHGYELRVAPEEVDLSQFQRLAEEGRASGNAAKLREALALWRGPALVDVRDETFAQHASLHLEEERLGVLEDRIAADLTEGCGAELVSELERLVREHPLRERLHGQLMLALYRAGRQADALEAYQRARRTLMDELGLEPSPRLQELELRILNQDPGLEAFGVAEQKAVSRRRFGPVTAERPPDSVALIDHEQASVVDYVPVGRRPVAVAVGHGSVWVANADDGTVSRIDPDRREVIRTIGIGAPAIDLAIGQGAVWVANGSDGTVSRIDPNVDAVVATIDLRGSSELAWNPAYAVDAGGDSIWVAVGPRHVVRIDPATNEVAATIDVHHVPASVAFGEEALWVVTLAERALRIEPGTNAATIAVAIGYPLALTSGHKAIWISDVRGQIWRVDPGTAAVSQTIPVGKGIVGLCADARALWAANNAEGWVGRIDAHDGQVVGHVTVGHAPTDVALEDGIVWVSIQRERAI